MSNLKPAQKLSVKGRKLGHVSWEYENGDVTLVGDRITSEEHGITLIVMKIDHDGIWVLPKEAECTKE